MKKITLDGRKADSRKDFHLYVKKKLSLPEYYGCNLDALVDCLGDISEETQITLTHFDEFQAKLGAYHKGFIRVFEDMAKENPNIKFKCK